MLKTWQKLVRLLGKIAEINACDWVKGNKKFSWSFFFFCGFWLACLLARKDGTCVLKCYNCEIKKKKQINK